MSECVEKQALKSHLKLEADCGHVSTLQDVFDIIDFIPAAEVRPVVRGRWEIVTGSNGKEYMVCSECRVSQTLTGTFSYCPNCGADMRGGGKE